LLDTMRATIRPWSIEQVKEKALRRKGRWTRQRTRGAWIGPYWGNKGGVPYGERALSKDRHEKC